MTLSLEQMKANRKLWVEALRSGKYRQTTAKLKARNGAMCCLGVLCEVAGLQWDWDDRYLVDGNALTAPPAAKEFVGLDDGDGAYRHDGDLATLTALNDNGKSFSEIADIIESEPEGLFIESVQP